MGKESAMLMILNLLLNPILNMIEFPVKNKSQYMKKKYFKQTSSLSVTV